MLAKDVMTANVFTVTPDTSVTDVAKLLLEKRISALPVIDGDSRVVGIVSEGDLIRRPEAGTEPEHSWWLRIFSLPEDEASEYVRTHGRTAEDVMTRRVVTVTEDTPLADAAELLETRRIKRVPVVRDGRLVGILSRSNLVQALATYETEPSSIPSAEDRNIRERIIDGIQKEFGGHMGLAEVTVSGGVVTLWGIADSKAEKTAMRVAAENTAGVTAVEDKVNVLPSHIRGLIWAE